jgi:hypothetical protein
VYVSWFPHASLALKKYRDTATPALAAAPDRYIHVS